MFVGGRVLGRHAGLFAQECARLTGATSSPRAAATAGSTIKSVAYNTVHEVRTATVSHKIACLAAYAKPI